MGSAAYLRSWKGTCKYAGVNFLMKCCFRSIDAMQQHQEHIIKKDGDFVLCLGGAVATSSLFLRNRCVFGVHERHKIKQN